MFSVHPSCSSRKSRMFRACWHDCSSPVMIQKSSLKTTEAGMPRASRMARVACVGRQKDSAACAEPKTSRELDKILITPLMGPRKERSSQWAGRTPTVR